MKRAERLLAAAALLLALLAIWAFVEVNEPKHEPCQDDRANPWCEK